MILTRSAWKRARTLLVVLCAALGVANFLQRYFETSSTDSADAPELVERVGSPEAKIEIQESLHLSPAAQTVAPARSSAEPDAGIPKQSGQVPPGATSADNGPTPLRARSGDPETRQPRTPEFKEDPATSGQIQNPKSKIQNPPAPNPRPPILEVVRSLGMVEQADGRIHAVIEVGGWVQVVEEGQLLTDNSRVVKIGAKSVELERPPAEPGIQIAEVAVPTKRTGAPAEIPQVDEGAATSKAEVVLRWNEKSGYAADTSPGSMADAAPGAAEVPAFESGQASYKETAPTSWNVRQHPIEKKPKVDRTEVSGTQGKGEFERSSSSPQQGILGVVELADDRVQTVVADGPWVKLVPEVTESPNGAVSPSAGPEMPPAGGLPREQQNGESDDVSLPDDKGASLPLPNFVEPIGLVEWPDGKLQAVLAQGDYIELTEDPALVADTRRILALAPPETPSDELAIRARDRPARAAEDQIAMLGPPEGDQRPRAPPESEEAPPREPEEAARGQPARAYALGSRAPPGRRANAGDFWQANLPGIEETVAANISRPASVEHLSSSVSAEPEDAPGRSVSSGGRENVRTSESEPLFPNRQAIGDENAGLRAAPVLEALGFVRWPDGRVKAVLAVGKSTVLVEEGQTLEDGTRVLEVGPGGVVLEPAGDQPANPGVAPEGHAKAPTSHLTPHQLAGSVLQLEPPVRNNRSQPRD